MRSNAKSVEGYLDGMQDDRREALAKVRNVILEHLPKGYEEATGFGMICYQVPLSV